MNFAGYSGELNETRVFIGSKKNSECLLFLKNDLNVHLKQKKNVNADFVSVEKPIDVEETLKLRNIVNKDCFVEDNRKPTKIHNGELPDSFRIR